MHDTASLVDLLHSGRTALVAGVSDSVGAVLAQRHGFDALWASGLAISATWGLPDTGLMTMTEMLQVSAIIARSVRLPVICDCDTGFGGVANMTRMVREYEAAGIAAVCVEDKEFPKRNSFLDGQRLADPCEFAGRLIAAAQAKTDPGFCIIARVEALIAGLSVAEALERATLYADSQADAILIHSKKTEPGQIIEFAAGWRTRRPAVPLIVVPTTYPSITVQDLRESGIAAAIYANQALRASVQAMDRVFTVIKDKGSSAELEDSIATVSEIFGLTATSQVEQAEREHAARVRELHAGGAGAAR
jgi:phosphoenolpyruvate phosphomutase